ncbi:MAG: cardiolipin synthase, partial [Lentisphaeria bacterium]|nr:cardiolipin synthase [Lentisphaeria bacterium]
VDVRIIVPRHNNHGFVALASRSLYGDLLRGGVRIYEKKGGFSHIKALLVDQEWGFMGSSNCDNRSFRLNYELDFCFEGGNMIREMRDRIREELQHSEAVDLYTVEHRNFVLRMAQNLCSLLSPIL